MTKLQHPQHSASIGTAIEGNAAEQPLAAMPHSSATPQGDGIVRGLREPFAGRSGKGVKAKIKAAKPGHSGSDDDVIDPSQAQPVNQAALADGSGMGAANSSAAPARLAQLVDAAEAGDGGEGAADSSGPSGHHGGGSIAPYLLGGLAVVGGGVALAAGGGGSSGTATPASVDTPTLALAADTGSSATDGVTNRSTIAVSNLQSGAKWEYSLDSGATWTTGSGSSFNLAPGTYAAGKVQVRQTSTAGTVSAAGKLGSAVTIDTSVAAPTIEKVTGDDVLSLAEARAANGVTVSGTGEPGATITLKWMVQDRVLIPVGTATVDQAGRWSYTFNGSAIPDASQPLTTQIKISATDLAGNTSDITSRTVVTDPGVTVSGTITAGAVIAGNDLKVNIYTGDGTLLAGGITVGADGRFSVANLPVVKGQVLIATVANGSAADFTDEASGQARNLSVHLLAALTIGDGAATLNLNPLTTLAAQALGLTADDAGALSGTTTAAAASAANLAVAQALGLSGSALASLTPVVVPADGYPAGATLTPAQQAGVLLAALSGLDNSNGGNAQQTLDALVSALTLAGNTGSFSDTGLAALMSGAQVASARLGVGLVGLVASQIAAATAASAVTIATVAGDDVINRTEAGTLVLTGTVAEGATAVSLQFGGADHEATLSGTSWSYSLTASDLAALDADGAVLIRATATLADGSTASSLRPALLARSLPDAPSIDKVLGDDLISSTERAAGVRVTGKAAAGATVAVSLNGGAARSVTADGDGNWNTTFTATELPARDGISQLTAIATDRFGNASAPASHALTIDLTAPDKPGIDAVAGIDLIGATLARAGVPVSGTGEPGGKVMVGWAGGTPHEATVGSNGRWTTTFSASELPGDGLKTLTAYQIDAAGNPGPSDLPPSEWPNFYFRIGHEGGIEWQGSTSLKTSLASCVKRRSCWRRAGRLQMRAGGSALLNKAITAGARITAA